MTEAHFSPQWYAASALPVLILTILGAWSSTKVFDIWERHTSWRGSLDHPISSHSHTVQSEQTRGIRYGARRGAPVDISEQRHVQPRSDDRLTRSKPPSAQLGNHPLREEYRAQSNSVVEGHPAAPLSAYSAGYTTNETVVREEVRVQTNAAVDPNIAIPVHDAAGSHGDSHTGARTHAVARRDDAEFPPRVGNRFHASAQAVHFHRTVSVASEVDRRLHQIQEGSYSHYDAPSRYDVRRR